MKILYVTTISNTVNAFLIPHIRMLIEQGHKVDVAFNIVQEVKSEIIELGCAVYNIEFQRAPFKKENYSAYKKLKVLIREGGYDLVHTHTPIASACVRLACRKVKDVKVIYTAHGFHFFKGAPKLKWLIYYPIEKLMSKFTECLITINKEDYDCAIKKKFKVNDIEYVQGVGVDTKKFKPLFKEEKENIRKKYSYKKDDFLLFYAAEFNKNKNQQILVESMLEIKNKVPKVKLILAGSGLLEQNLKELSKKLNTEDVIDFIGQRSDLDQIVPMCDVVIASSYREGLPVNIMEAMACGLPIVASDNRGHRELVEDDINGYIVSINNASEYAEKIIRISSDEELYKKLSMGSIKCVEKFTLPNVMLKMKTIYKKYM